MIITRGYGEAIRITEEIVIVVSVTNPIIEIEVEVE